MNVNDLLKLKRPLTDEESDFLEQETLALANQLKDEVEQLTKDMDPDDPVVAHLRAHTANVGLNLEQAIECSREEKVVKDYARANAKERGAVDYTWEKLPVYAWNNEFARVIGRLLCTIHKRYHIHLHNLAGQAMLMSNCIALGHRDLAPGETVSREELRAYRFIACFAAERTLEMLDDLSKATGYSACDVAHAKTLLRRMRDQFEKDVREIDEAAATSAVMH